MKKENRKRKAKRMDAGEVYGPYHRWIGTLPCEIWGNPDHRCQPGTVKGHHDRSVGNGGQDYGNEIPLCNVAHTSSPKSVHRMGRESWQEFWGIDINERKAHYAARWDAGERGPNG